MTLHTPWEGIVKALTSSLLDMQHLTFCLLMGLVLFTQRRKPHDLWLYITALFPGYALERLQPLPAVLIHAVVALTVLIALFHQWFYEKMASYTRPFLVIAGLFHGLSLSRELSGSSTPAFLAFACSAALIQALVMYGFGRWTRHLAQQSPDSFEGLENILSAVGIGVALAYFVLAF